MIDNAAVVPQPAHPLLLTPARCLSGADRTADAVKGPRTWFLVGVEKSWRQFADMADPNLRMPVDAVMVTQINVVRPADDNATHRHVMAALGQDSVRGRL